MTGGYTKLFSTIVTSTIWQEDDATRLVWITMLALSNKSGFVSATLPGLAHIARVSREDAQSAIDKLSKYDEHSRSPDNNGRRVESRIGGWQILNYARYRMSLSQDDRREYMRNYMVNKRKKANNVAKVSNVNTKKETVTDSEWLTRLSNDPTYSGINIHQLHGKMVNWCKVNGKTPTRRRFVNWINKEEKPMGATKESAPVGAAYRVFDPDGPPI